MKIVIPGGSGHVGTLLAEAFLEQGHEVVVLSRAPANARWRVVSWDARTPGAWTREVDGADAVINLAGRSVDCRYGERNRREILESRVLSTRAVGEAIAGSKSPPRVWLQASTATIYAHRFDAANTESTGILGGSESGVPDTWRFSIEVANAWEREVDRAATPRTRKVKLRSAMTMSRESGGIFDVLLRLVRFGFGGPAGGGRQYVSWIHGEDFRRAVFWLLSREEVDGPVNVCSPNPLPNEEFMRDLRRVARRSVGLPSTRWMLGLGAFFLRTETELLLKSRRVVPERLLREGFEFQFPRWASAAADLCARPT